MEDSKKRKTTSGKGGFLKTVGKTIYNLGQEYYTLRKEEQSSWEALYYQL